MRPEEKRPPAGAGATPYADRACPFCRARTATRLCASCGRDTNAPRRPCRSCGQLVPSGERACWSCGAPFRSEMLWKIPLIIFLFLVAFAVSVALAVLS